ncbi:MAG: NAD-dependent epimerase/dehydratase family protein, partial [Candidatus Marinimicrobia bacterium]|nr:NAD-dependent epimerase/dehydratase family protein [Candidatus Neomarinimicrobiota bacterium]
MNIAVAGSSGFIGTALVAFLEAGGHTVVRLIRRSHAPGSSEIFWNPAQGVL